MTKLHNGHEYRIVKQYAEDEYYGYRPTGNGHIEVIECFVGEVRTKEVHVATIQAILAADEFQREWEARDKQAELQEEHKRITEGAAAA